MIAICVTLAILMLLFVFFTVLNRLALYVALQNDITDCKSFEGITKKYEAIVVLGAGVMPDGTPSQMLEDRLRGAVELYKNRASDKVILSGDNSGEEYDEVSSMLRYCLEHGVPEDAIIRDDKGFSTYETIYNTVVLSGYKNIIVVTQKYHLYRAMYIGSEMGARVDGFATDYREYKWQSTRNIREYFARAKDVLRSSLPCIDTPKDGRTS